jgi:formamidopyrimidine-DNA glycosylase
MPELPEVDAIAGVARKYAPGGSIRSIHVIRSNGKYLNVRRAGSEFTQYGAGHLDVIDVYRMGKRVVFDLASGAYIVIHNAMTGYLDWAHEPWTFDYVEGKRKVAATDIRVQFHFSDGKILRFHDARLFGSVELTAIGPAVTPSCCSLRTVLPP